MCDVYKVYKQEGCTRVCTAHMRSCALELGIETGLSVDS